MLIILVVVICFKTFIISWGKKVFLRFGESCEKNDGKRGQSSYIEEKILKKAHIYQKEKS